MIDRPPEDCLPIYDAVPTFVQPKTLLKESEKTAPAGESKEKEEVSVRKRGRPQKQVLAPIAVDPLAVILNPIYLKRWSNSQRLDYIPMETEQRVDLVHF